MAEVFNLKYQLNEEAIVEITEYLDDLLKKYKVQSKNKTVFMLESMLLDIRAHYSDTIDVSVSMRKRLGRNTLRVTYAGEEFNPITADEAGPQTQILLANMGLVPSWSYKDHGNEITLAIPRNHLRDDSYLLIALISSVIAGLIGPHLPQAFTSFVSEYILCKLSDIFLSFLSVFAGILIFFSILSGICGMESTSDLSKKGRYMLSRTLFSGLLGAVIGGTLFIPFFRFTYGTADVNNGMEDIYRMILDIIPSDPVTPFMEGNMLQISLIAVILGGIMILLDNRVSQVRELVLQSNTIMISTVEFICRLLPIYIFADLTKLFWDNGLDIILITWKPLTMCIAINLLYTLYKLARVSLKYRISIGALFKKVFPSFMIGLTTASSMAAYGTSLDINESKLGIDHGYSAFATALKNQLHSTNGILSFIIVIYFFTQYSGTTINPAWFVSVWIVVFLINPAIPPVSGGVLVCMGIIMDQFGIPASCLGMAATLIMIFDFISTGSKVVLVHMDEIEEADHLGLLNKKILSE